MKEKPEQSSERFGLKTLRPLKEILSEQVMIAPIGKMDLETKCLGAHDGAGCSQGQSK